MYYTIYASSEESYMYCSYTNTIKQTTDNNKKEDNTEKICIICWVDTEISPMFLKQNKNFITFCDCNTTVHDDCLMRWYCRTFSCPICRAYIIYDPSFTNNIRLQRMIRGYVSYGYNIINPIAKFIYVFVVWNIALNILCNIYLVFYPIAIKK